MRRILSLVTLMALVLITPIRGADQPEWREISGPPELEFPRDHGAHTDTSTEWWYVTGLTTGEDDHRYGFQITFFRQGLASGAPEPGSSTLRARQIAAAHLAITDIATGKFLHAERLRRSGGGLAGWSEIDLDVWLEDWTIRRNKKGGIVVQAQDPAAGIGLDLELRPQRLLVLHGDNGYSRKGAEQGNASAYLSWSRLAAAGRIVVAGKTIEVTGQAWFDHEWGSSQLGEGVTGWDWFSLRLADGRDLMAYQLRRNDGTADAFSSGTVVTADGTPIRLERDDVSTEPLEWWTSPSSGGRYPVRWRLRVPDHGIDLEVAGLVPESELDGSATTGVIYWEGPVEASGSSTGEGYVELTGYAGSLEGRF